MKEELRLIDKEDKKDQSIIQKWNKKYAKEHIEQWEKEMEEAAVPETGTRTGGL